MRSTETSPSESSAGFTLLETLAALTILAIAIVSLFEAQATGLRATSQVSAHSKARILAQSLLAETTNNWDGGMRSSSGRYDTFAWVVEVVPAAYDWAEIKSEHGWRLFQIRVAVDWDKGRRVQLESMKVGRVNE